MAQIYPDRLGILSAEGDFSGAIFAILNELNGNLDNSNLSANFSATLTALSQLPSGSSAQIIVANGSGVPTYVAMSGDTTISNAGAVTVAKINGATLGTTTATSGNILIGSGSQWATQAISGDITVTSGGVTAIGTGKVAASMVKAEAWAAWTPSPTGFSSIASSVALYIQYGKTVHCYVNISGTSNSTSTGFSLPVAAKNGQQLLPFKGADNGAVLTTFGYGDVSAAGTAVNLFTTPQGSAWTGSGSKAFEANLTYEAN